MHNRQADVYKTRGHGISNFKDWKFMGGICCITISFKAVLLGSVYVPL